MPNSPVIIANIYYMLSYAYKYLQHDAFKEIKTEAFDNVPDLFAAILAKAVALQIKRGLSREYIEKSENIYILKGKIDIVNSINLRTQNKRRLACAYDELSENYQMNQILKTTMHYLINDESVKRKNRDDIKGLLLFFSDVEVLEPSKISWRTLRYHRYNSCYQMLMGICYLVFNNLLLTTEAGDKKLASFFDEQRLSSLFESFVREYYVMHFPSLGARAASISWITQGSTTFLPTMNTDVMLEYKGYGIEDNKKLIIDTKFYPSGIMAQLLHGGISVRSAHLYQIFAYVKNADKQQNTIIDGMLLYAKTTEEVLPNEIYNLCGNRISVRTLDLNAKFDDIAEELDRIIHEWIPGKLVKLS